MVMLRTLNAGRKSKRVRFPSGVQNIIAFVSERFRNRSFKAGYIGLNPIEGTKLRISSFG